MSVLERERFFTADVSHEMRTPLTIMLGTAEVLHSRLRDRPELQVMAERIRRNASDTALQVGALLKLAQAPETIEKADVDLSALIKHEIERHKPLLRGRPVDIDFKCDEAVIVKTVPELVSIAIGNLIRNSCQYTAEGNIVVTLSIAGITIEDTGLGIPQAVRDRLFLPFNRGSTDSSTGTGIGLSIVKRVISHLGWEIEHDSPENNGSRFQIHFASPEPI